jgi:hypothetical protein
MMLVPPGLKNRRRDGLRNPQLGTRTGRSRPAAQRGTGYFFVRLAGGAEYTTQLPPEQVPGKQPSGAAVLR